MKKPKIVVDAEAALSATADKLTAAKEALKLAEAEHAAAYAAVRHAQAVADESLPQCRVIRASWHSGKEEDVRRVVILRSTPSGMLVVRRVGRPEHMAEKFKWDKWTGKFRQAEKTGYTSDSRELRDVPAEFLPKPSNAA